MLRSVSLTPDLAPITVSATVSPALRPRKDSLDSTHTLVDRIVLSPEEQEAFLNPKRLAHHESLFHYGAILEVQEHLEVLSELGILAPESNIGSFSAATRSSCGLPVGFDPRASTCGLITSAKTNARNCVIMPQTSERDHTSKTCLYEDPLDPSIPTVRLVTPALPAACSLPLQSDDSGGGCSTYTVSLISSALPSFWLDRSELSTSQHISRGPSVSTTKDQDRPSPSPPPLPPKDWPSKRATASAPSAVLRAQHLSNQAAFTSGIPGRPTLSPTSTITASLSLDDGIITSYTEPNSNDDDPANSIRAIPTTTTAPTSTVTTAPTSHVTDPTSLRSTDLSDTQGGVWLFVPTKSCARPHAFFFKDDGEGQGELAYNEAVADYAINPWHLRDGRSHMIKICYEILAETREPGEGGYDGEDSFKFTWVNRRVKIKTQRKPLVALLLKKVKQLCEGGTERKAG